MGRSTVIGNKAKGAHGFTLVELMVVIAIMITILSIAIPMYTRAIVRTKESVLKSNLFTIRAVIDQYTYDKEAPPQSLDELVSERYLRSVPMDPFTESSSTWDEISDTGPSGESGLFDVKSGSDRVGLDGSKYSEW